MVHRDDVLAQLDAARADFKLPDLGHGYYYAIDCRLHAFSDRNRWALVVETVGYHPRARNVYDVLHTFGDCLTTGEPGFEDDDFWPRIENMDDVEDADSPERLAAVATVRVRGQDLAIDATPGTALVDVFRTLTPEHRELLLATEPEVRRRIPTDLAKVLQLDEWHQPDPFELAPGASELYQQLADVVAEADPSHYRPTQPPNTHWSNWPDSGTL